MSRGVLDFCYTRRAILATQLEFYLHEQTQIVASVACRVGSQQFIAR